MPWVLAAAAVSFGLALFADGRALQATLAVVGLSLLGLTLFVRGLALADRRRKVAAGGAADAAGRRRCGPLLFH